LVTGIGVGVGVGVDVGVGVEIGVGVGVELGVGVGEEVGFGVGEGAEVPSEFALGLIGVIAFMLLQPQRSRLKMRKTWLVFISPAQMPN
jgi:hypothetical protein